MSVLKNIKAGLKSITSRDSSKQEVNISISRSTVNFDAGADLLARYQDVWKDLHDSCQENAREAEDLDSKLTDMYVKNDRQQEVMTRLHDSIIALPILVSQLQQATDLLASLEGEYEKVNTGLIQLEDTIEEQELLTAQIIDTRKLSEYNQRKQDDLENCKVQLAKDHARKIQDCEKKKKNSQKDREEAFQGAFEDDLDYYKTYGHIEKVSVSSSDGSKKMEIADVSFDEEDGGLDEFLGSNEFTALNENHQESTEETENVFSEDDYLPKLDDESDFVKSGETATSDSDVDSKQQQQNSIQTWINNSGNDNKVTCEKDEKDKEDQDTKQSQESS